MNQPSYNNNAKYMSSMQSSEGYRFRSITMYDSLNPAENVGLQKFGVRPRDDYLNSHRAALLILSYHRWIEAFADKARRRNDGAFRVDAPATP